MTSSPTTEVATSNLPIAGTYNVDAVHSTIGFVARHLVASKVRGRFTEFTGVITIGDTLENSSVEATVQAASITTDNEMRDAHLKSPDFLEFETYPTLTLKSPRSAPRATTSRSWPTSPSRASPSQSRSTSSTSVPDRQ